MHALKAHVKGGRLLLDEPTDLPDGSEVEVRLVNGEEFEPEERARLLENLSESQDEYERGDHADALEFLALLRAGK